MKKFKKILFLALSMVIALSLLTGCSSSKTEDQIALNNSSVTAKIIELDLTSEEYAFGVDKNQPELLEKTNTFITEIKADGTFDEICNNYFGDGKPVEVTSAALDETKDQLVVATSTGFEPFEMVDQNGKYSGVHGGGQLVGLELAAVSTAHQSFHIGNIRQQGGQNHGGHIHGTALQTGLPVKGGDCLGHIQTAVGCQTFQNSLGTVHGG